MTADPATVPVHTTGAYTQEMTEEFTSAQFDPPAHELRERLLKRADRIHVDSAGIGQALVDLPKPHPDATLFREAADALASSAERIGALERELADLNQRFDLELDAYAKDADIGAANLRADKAESNIAAVKAERDEALKGEPNAEKALDELATRWAVKSWMTEDFPQQACEDFKRDILRTYVSLARPYLNRATEAESALAAVKAERDAYEANALATQMLAFKWMEAHDKRATGKPYSFPSPADLPKALATSTLLREALTVARREIVELRTMTRMSVVCLATDMIDAALKGGSDGAE